MVSRVAGILLAILQVCTAVDAQESPFELVPILQEKQSPQRVGLFSEGVAQGGDPETEKILEGYVETHGQELLRVRLPSAKAEAVIFETRWAGSKLYLLEIEFTLEKLPEGKAFRTMKLLVDFAGEAVEAIDFFPRKWETRPAISRSLTISRTLSLIDVEGPRGVISLNDLQPVMTGTRHSARTLSWELAGENTVDFGTRRVYVLVAIAGDSPQTALAGALQYEASIGTVYFKRVWRAKSATSDPVSFQLQLTGSTHGSKGP